MHGIELFMNVVGCWGQNADRVGCSEEWMEWKMIQKKC